jgi:hypothetical protein
MDGVKCSLCQRSSANTGGTALVRTKWPSTVIPNSRWFRPFLPIAPHPAKAFDRERDFVAIEEAHSERIVDVRALFRRHRLAAAAAAAEVCSELRADASYTG